MKFTSPGVVEYVVWNMRLADLPRGTNRALINRLANGNPPYTESERSKNRIKTNVNYLEFPKLVADARRSLYNALLNPGNFFTVTLDYGPVYKRREWSRIITRELNKILKESLPYFESLRCQIASTILHGVGPVFWPEADDWVPQSIGMEDLMIPSNTLLSLENLDYFAIFRQYTPMQLYRMTHGPNVDPGWNMPVVKAALQWADQQTQAQFSYTDLYAPEKVEERFKQDLGFYGTDAVPTVDLWDFYFWSDEGKEAGWRRRMVLDTPMSTEITARAPMPGKNLIGLDHGQWLYNPGNRRWADKSSEILHFQFGDLSAVAPFRYHSVRSLGWLLYAVCHLQNRLMCKLNDHIFENLLQYFRSGNAEDKERIVKVDLHDLGVIPEGIAFVPQSERWQVNQNLVELGLTQNRSMMVEAAAQYREGRDAGAQAEVKTATQIMAEVNAANALVGSMMKISYIYATAQYQEISRRFCQKDSPVQAVKRFRLNALKAGVPEAALNCSTWNIEPERVIGQGNKTLQIAIADKLFAARPFLDPESQREVLHLYVESNSDDPDLANRLVPLESQPVSDSKHDAELMLGPLLQGIPVTPRKGQNPVEIIEVMLAVLDMKIKTLLSAGSIPDIKELTGFSLVADTVKAYIAILSEDREAKDKVREFEDALKEIMNLLKAFAQQLAEQTAAGNGKGQPQIDPKDAAKVQAMNIQAQAKAANTRESHAQRTAQRQVQWEMEQKRKQEEHNLEMQRRLQEQRTDAAAKDIETASTIALDAAQQHAKET